MKEYHSHDELDSLDMLSWKYRMLSDYKLHSIWSSNNYLHK